MIVVDDDDDDDVHDVVHDIETVNSHHTIHTSIRHFSYHMNDVILPKNTSVNQSGTL